MYVFHANKTTFNLSKLKYADFLDIFPMCDSCITVRKCKDLQSDWVFFFFSYFHPELQNKNKVIKEIHTEYVSLTNIESNLCAFVFNPLTQKDVARVSQSPPSSKICNRL